MKMKTLSAILLLLSLAVPTFAATDSVQRYLMDLGVNDTYANLLWALNNTGQEVASTTGTVDADMDIAEAWQLIRASTTSEVLVGIIDTGVL